MRFIRSFFLHLIAMLAIPIGVSIGLFSTGIAGIIGIGLLLSLAYLICTEDAEDLPPSGYQEQSKTKRKHKHGKWINLSGDDKSLATFVFAEQKRELQERTTFLEREYSEAIQDKRRKFHEELAKLSRPQIPRPPEPPGYSEATR